MSHTVVSFDPFTVEYKSSTGRTKKVKYEVPLTRAEILAEEPYIVFDEEPKSTNCLLKINLPTDEFCKQMLLSSLSFIHPMKKLEETAEIVLIKLFDCSTVEQLNDKLLALCEASTVDFSYSYGFQ